MFSAGSAQIQYVHGFDHGAMSGGNACRSPRKNTTVTHCIVNKSSYKIVLRQFPVLSDRATDMYCVFRLCSHHLSKNNIYCPGFMMHDHSDTQPFKTQLKAHKNTMHQLTGHSPVPLLLGWRKVQSQISLELKRVDAAADDQQLCDGNKIEVEPCYSVHSPTMCRAHDYSFEVHRQPCCVPSQRLLIQIVGPGH